jgi:hypothetical protein
LVSGVSSAGGGWTPGAAFGVGFRGLVGRRQVDAGGWFRDRFRGLDGWWRMDVGGGPEMPASNDASRIHVIERRTAVT